MCLFVYLIIIIYFISSAKSKGCAAIMFALVLVDSWLSASQRSTVQVGTKRSFAGIKCII